MPNSSGCTYFVPLCNASGRSHSFRLKASPSAVLRSPPGVVDVARSLESRPIYSEVLYSASRCRPERNAELQQSVEGPIGQLERLVAGTQANPADYRTVPFALYLAEVVSSLLCPGPVGAYTAQELVNDATQQLLTPAYWIRPIYSELLYAASRVKKTRHSEIARP